MNEPERIADHMQRAMDGNAWHGPALREVLQGVTPETAAARPIAGAHSIWELLLHVTAWTRAIRRRLNGDPARLPPEEDWPPVPQPSATAWKAALDQLEQAHQELLSELARLPADRLDQPIIPDMPSVYVSLHGLVQHHLYHAGQIALLKKAVSAQASKSVAAGPRGFEVLDSPGPGDIVK
jgi:uncharacterized damage-inducible protein DinB